MQDTTDRDIPIIHLMQNTDSGITAAAEEVPQRETIGRVAAGAIALKILESLGITLHAYAKEIGGIAIDYEKFDLQAARENAFTMPDKEAAAKVEAYATQRYRRAIQSAVSLRVWLRA